MNLDDLKKWREIKGDDTLRIDYPLTEDSIVLDLGGNEGSWSEKIIKKYNPYIFIFEPIPKLYNNLVNKFNKNNKIKIYNAATSDKNTRCEISNAGAASSLYIESNNKIIINTISLINFLKENNINHIDLIKINIEGAEYCILEDLINNNMVQNITDIQVQFHQFMPDSSLRRKLIREKLSNTHKITYDYEFVWENWKKI